MRGLSRTNRALYDFLDRGLTIVEQLLTSIPVNSTTHWIATDCSVQGSFLICETSRRRVITCSLHASLEPLRVVDGLFIVKHSFSLIVCRPWHFLLFLFNRIKYCLPLSLGEATTRVDLLLREEHFFEVCIVIRSRN